MEPRDSRWLWILILVAGLALVGWWIADGGARWVHAGWWVDLDFDLEATTAGVASFVAIVAALVTVIAALVGARKRILWPALPLTVAIAALLAIPLSAIADVVTSRRPGLHATEWLVVSYVIDVLLAAGGIGLWIVARAQRRRAATELAEVERAIAVQQGDLT